MTGIVVRRTALELWDNGVVAFGLNLVVVALVLAGLMLVEAAAASTLLFTLAVPAVLICLVVALVVIGQLFDDIVVQRDLVLRRVADSALRVLPVAILLVPPLVGFSAAVAATPSLLPETGPARVASLVVILWGTLVAAELCIAGLVSRAFGQGPGEALHEAGRHAFGHPGTAAVLMLAGGLLCIVTICLLPGLVGFMRLHQNAVAYGRMAETRPAGQSWRGFIAAEHRGLARRGLRSILMPWRYR